MCTQKITYNKLQSFPFQYHTDQFTANLAGKLRCCFGLSRRVKVQPEPDGRGPAVDVQLVRNELSPTDRAYKGCFFRSSNLQLVCPNFLPTTAIFDYRLSIVLFPRTIWQAKKIIDRFKTRNDSTSAFLLT